MSNGSSLCEVILDNTQLISGLNEFFLHNFTWNLTNASIKSSPFAFELSFKTDYS